MRFATKAIRAGQSPDAGARSVIPPIYQTATFAFHEIGKHAGYEYSRTGNPTRTALETCLAALEEANHGLAFASGSAATDAVLSLLRPGDHVVAGNELYGGTFRLFEALWRPRGIDFTYVDPRDPDAFAAALKPNTRMVWVETPANPLLTLTDIAAVAKLAGESGALLVADNTFASPYFQRPITQGADIVIHSTTKFINGHSDVVGGAVLVNDPELHAALATYQNAAGAVPGPFDCWLTLRGLRTLAVRLRQQADNALRVAHFLASHPAVESVLYPGLPSHPQHGLACRQMDGFGALVTFRIAGNRVAANDFVKNLKVFLFAESLGGVESLACHPTTMSHGALTEAERLAMGITEGTVRLSVGIEDSGDLLDDLDQALRTARNLVWQGRDGYGI